MHTPQVALPTQAWWSGKEAVAEWLPRRGVVELVIRDESRISRCPLLLPPRRRFRSPVGSTASATRSATSWPRRGRSRLPGGRPLPEHRRSDRGRLHHAAAPDRGRQPRHAARTERLHAVAGHPGGEGGGRRRLHGARLPRRSRSRAAHDGHVRGHRDHAQRAGRPRRRSARAGADLSALHGGGGQDRARSRCSTAPTRTTAGSPTSLT